jgi:hypothetical protein
MANFRLEMMESRMETLKFELYQDKLPYCKYQWGHYLRHPPGRKYRSGRCRPRRLVRRVDPLAELLIRGEPEGGLAARFLLSINSKSYSFM